MEKFLALTKKRIINANCEDDDKKSFLSLLLACQNEFNIYKKTNRNIIIPKRFFQYCFF